MSTAERPTPTPASAKRWKNLQFAGWAVLVLGFVVLVVGLYPAYGRLTVFGLLFVTGGALAVLAARFAKWWRHG